MSRDHASAEERFRCLYAEHVDPILRTGRRGSGDSRESPEADAGLSERLDTVFSVSTGSLTGPTSPAV